MISSAFLLGLFLPGIPLFLAGAILAQTEFRRRYAALTRLSRSVQWSEERHRQAVERCKKLAKARAETNRVANQFLIQFPDRMEKRA